MVTLRDAKQAPLATAQSLAKAGFQILPARHKDRAPIVPWTKYQKDRTDHLLPSWFGSATPLNYWGMTGRMSMVVVIDCDSEAGDLWWRERIGDQMDATAKVQTKRGYHYYFAIPDDYYTDDTTTLPSWSVHPKEDDPWTESWDVRADGTGVIMPGSVHESGHVYRWVDCDPEDPRAKILPAPPGLLDGTYRQQAPVSGSSSGTATRKDAGGNTRSMLTSLLANPPGGEGSGRNDWLARVAGHYAKTYHNQEDLYRSHVEQANAMMAEPLDDKEFRKTTDSVWKGEHERNPQRAVDADCGWLQDGGYVIMTQVVIKGQDDSKTYDMAPYANFNLKAKGVMIDEAGGRTYWVDLLTRRPGTRVDQIDAVLPAATLGDERKLRTWLATYGVNVLPPNNMWPKEGTSNLRIQRYLESQQPPTVTITPALGWHDEVLDGIGGFVTHEGVVTATATIPMDECGVRANPILQVGGVAPHAYGFSQDGLEAKRVLREVMSFHEPQITSVFGAWWAACLVKPQIEQISSLFPFVAIEAPSESGKTNGFFDMMTQLNGNTRGESQSTKAALRDMAAAHKNGIVWIDDMDDPANLMELLRAATSGGTITKMGEDRVSVKNAKIVSPIVISGEQLGMSTQKALIDRAITINATSPTGRKSVHDPNRPQWDDILDLREQYPHGLSDVAGWLVQNALGTVEHVLGQVRAGRRGVAGRAADKVAILRAGARLLDYLVAEDEDSYDWDAGGEHTAEVERYLSGDGAVSATSQFDNALTLHILPWALRQFDYPDKAYAKKFDDRVHTPVFIKTPMTVSNTQLLLGGSEPEVEIWFSVPFLAQAWEQHRHGRVDKRTESEGALKQQADALPGRAPGKQVKIVNGGGTRGYFRVIKGEMVQVLLQRARGE